MAGLNGKASRRGIEGVSKATEAERRDTHTSLPGEIVDFDPATQTATVKIMYKPTVNGQAVEPPLLKKVPVSQPRAGGFSMTAPLKPGDPLNISFDGADTSDYYETGQQSAGGTKRMNSLSDATATPGRAPGSKALANMDPENMHIGTEDGKSGVRVTPGGKLALEGPGGAEDVMVILSELLDLLTNDKLDVKIGSSKGKVHALENKTQYAALKARLDSMKLN